MDNIHLVIADPYGGGWVSMVEPTSIGEERGSLPDVAPYLARAEPRLDDKRAPPVDEYSADDFDIDPNRRY